MNLNFDRDIILYTNLKDEDIKRLWKMFPEGNIYWSKGDGENYQKFYKSLKESVMLIEAPFGYIRVESLDYGESARLHGAFLGPSIFKNKDLLFEIANKLEELARIKRIEVSIPVGCKSLQKLLIFIGFQRVGPGVTLIHSGNTIIPGDLWVLSKEAWHERRN